MYENVGAAPVWLDKAEALVGVEEFNNASLGHASVPFSLRPPSVRAASLSLPLRALAGSSRSLRKGSLYLGRDVESKPRGSISNQADRSIGVSGAHSYKDFPCS